MNQNPPTDQQLADIEARAQAATSGPWGVYESGGLIDVAADLQETGHGYQARRGICRLDEEPLDNDRAHREWTAEEDWAQVQADAEFIAHAPEDVRVLLAEVRRQRAELAAMHTKTLALEADAIVKHCPDHGPRDQARVWMDCHCAVADDMRRRAAAASAVAVTGDEHPAASS